MRRIAGSLLLALILVLVFNSACLAEDGHGTIYFIYSNSEPLLLYEVFINDSMSRLGMIGASYGEDGLGWLFDTGIRLYTNRSGYRTYWGGNLLYANNVLFYGDVLILQGVYGFSWQFGKNDQIRAFVEGGLGVAYTGSELVIGPAVGVGIGKSI